MADDDRHAGYRNALSQHFRILTELLLAKYNQEFDRRAAAAWTRK
jgi:hypothetical protein